MDKNKLILNNKLDELKEIAAQMEIVIETLTQNADKQMIVYNQLINTTDTVDKIFSEYEMTTLKNSEKDLWIKLFRLDEKVDEILKDILAQFPDGEKALWRVKMEERYPGVIARFDKVCDFVEETGSPTMREMFLEMFEVSSVNNNQKNEMT